MPLRIAFDLDGVFADMDGALARQAEALFGEAMTGRLREAGVNPAETASHASSNPGTNPAKTGSHKATLSLDAKAEAESRRSSSPAANPAKAGSHKAAEAGFRKASEPNSPVDEPPFSRLKMTARQLRRLWSHVETIENFWETLGEIEPGSVSRLAALAADRRWEVIFLTRRPASAGATSQLQSQRWLKAKGFALPSVFVVQGSRGRIAASLALDFVVDDTPENCLDVVVDSKARAILVWRDERQQAPAAAKRLGIGLVRSVDECLGILSQIDAATHDKPGVMNRVMRLLGLKEPAKATQ